MDCGRDWIAALVSDFLDAVVIVGDFQRAEVELANVRGFERILAAALAALERLHESFVFFHNLCYFSFFPNHPIRAGIGTCIEIKTSTGCRGVTGPVPQPLCMRPLVSTDADRLI
jgi:hypothetical protein